MNKLFYNTTVRQLFFLLLSVSILQVACKKDNGAPPVIKNVRLVDSTKRDSFFVQAVIGSLLTIQGQGFNGLSHVYFNNVDAPFNAALNSDQNIIITIPSNTPTQVTDASVPNQIKVVTTHGTALYTFTVLEPPPAINTISNENAQPGTAITITGSNFYLIKSIIFPGNISTTNFAVSADVTSINVTVPAGVTTAGPLQVVGQFGTGVTPYPFNSVGAPSAGFLANFENGNAYFGWQYWGGIYTNWTPSYLATFPGNTGDFIVVNPSGTINAGDGTWYADNRAVNVAAGAWVPSSNMSDPVANYALKFEISVAVPWTAGSFMIAPNGNFNFLARYAPWQTSASGQFVTNGWQTVTIPLTSFLSGSGSYNASGSPANHLSDLTGSSNSATIQIMLYNDGTTPITSFNAAVDNVRIVKIK